MAKFKNKYSNHGKFSYNGFRLEFTGVFETEDKGLINHLRKSPDCWEEVLDDSKSSKTSTNVAKGATNKVKGSTQRAKGNTNAETDTNSEEDATSNAETDTNSEETTQEDL
jgi:hypothetical protein